MLMPSSNNRFDAAAVPSPPIAITPSISRFFNTFLMFSGPPSGSE